MTLIRSREWFTKVFDRHYDHLRNYLYYLSGDINWADDAVQEVFLVVWDKRNTVRDETLKAFIFKVGRNLFLKSKRREAAHLKFEMEKGDEAAVLTPGEEFEAHEFDLALQNAVSDLPDRCRTVFLMSRMDEMSNRQIAESLGVSVKAVEKQITRALKVLHERMGSFKAGQ